MEQHIQGRKAEEVAALPTYRFKLNLQHFADEPTPTDIVDPDVAVDEENITWEQFDSDKPKDEQEQAQQPDVADPEPEKPKQDHETNKAFQEMRKKVEDAERKAKQADDWVKNTYGASHGLETWDQYQTALAEEKKRAEYQEKGIDYDEVRKIAKEEAETHPDVLKARQIEQNNAVQAEINDLNTSYPDYKIASVDDVFKLPNSEKIIERINKGYSLKDAFELANLSEITQKRTAAAEQAARNKINSKAHLKPSSSGDAGELFVMPDDVMAMYREMNRKLPKDRRQTDEQMRAHYKKSLGK